jgi:hypothetical protein
LQAEAILAKIAMLDTDSFDEGPTLLITSDQVWKGSLPKFVSISQPIDVLYPNQYKNVKVVVHEGAIREKPSDETEARAFIKSR